MMISTHGYVASEAEFGKPDTGGQVVYVLELSKVFARLGYSVDILTRRFERQRKQERVAERVRILRFPCGGQEFIPKEFLCEHIPEWVENVERFVRRHRLNYAFIDSHYWDAGLAGQALSHQLGIPHVHTPHSIGAWKRDNMDGDPQEMERKYNFHKRIREERVIYDECDAVIATTPLQRDILEKGGEYDVAPEKVRIVPPGYDDMRFFSVSKARRSALKTEYGYEGCNVLSLGRIARNKGYDLLLKAMPVVFKRIENSRLLLAAGSPEPSEDELGQIEELKSLAKDLKIADRVVFLNYISDEQLPDYYRMADVFALPSRYEPFGMAAVEAMACGTPTVITTEGGLWQEITWGQEALYASPFDPESFGHMLYTVLDLPGVADRLARFGPQKARSRFAWLGVGQQILRIFDALEPGSKEKHDDKRRRGQTAHS